jgi:hypothetical protein
VRRGSVAAVRKTVCALGSNSALAPGPSTSILGAADASSGRTKETRDEYELTP